MTDRPHRSSRRHPDLDAIARRTMQDRGFLVEFPEEAQAELAAESEPDFQKLKIQDRTSWFWSSIDNDSSRDLDQIEYAERERDGTRICVGVADVDWFVPLRSGLDHVAQQNTTSVYTGVLTFPMLPERLSTDLSSLNEGVRRLAIVVEMLVTDDGRLEDSSVYPAIVENKAQLTYNAVAAWLDAETESNARLDTMSKAGERTLLRIHQSRELQDQLRLQDKAAKSLRKARHEAGALTFQTSEMNPVLSSDGLVIDLETRHQNRASLLIEDFMIAANRATARFLDESGFPSFRRIVKTPQRWDRIVALAASQGHDLPGDPDAKSLEAFLQSQRHTNPDHFADLSLAVIKLIGRGEYAVKFPGEDMPGHFSLAVNAYAHSTAPNRRFPDLITQRLVKASLSHSQPPYLRTDLQALATHCTEREDAAGKVERFVKKCAAAVVLEKRIGELFDAVVSGINEDGTWVRVSHPLVEGKLLEDTRRLDVGHRLRVRLASTDPERGFIDFEVA